MNRQGVKLEDLKQLEGSRAVVWPEARLQQRLAKEKENHSQSSHGMLLFRHFLFHKNNTHFLGCS